MISRCRTCRYRASSSPALPSRFYPALAIALGLLASCAPMCAQLVRVPAIRTVAGNGSNGYLSTQDGGQATAAELYFEKSLAVDAAGNLYIADTNNNRIREVAAATGIITTVAGTGSAGYNPSQDGGQATLAELNHPYGVALDGFGNL